MYWTEIHGGQLLSRPKLTKSCSVYKEEDLCHRNQTKPVLWQYFLSAIENYKPENGNERCCDLKVCVYKMEKRMTGQENERRKDRD
jgi:hypothetical protein